MAETQSLFLKVHYPEEIGPLKGAVPNELLAKLQQTEILWGFQCSLGMLVIPSTQTPGRENTSVIGAYYFCKSAPAWNPQRQIDTVSPFVPTILVELYIDVSLDAVRLANITMVVKEAVQKYFQVTAEGIKIRLLTYGVPNSGFLQYQSSNSSGIFSGKVAICNWHWSFLILCLCIMFFLMTIYYLNSIMLMKNAY